MFGKKSTSTQTALDVLQNVGPQVTNQNTGVFPERSASTCNVEEFSNFVVKLLFVFVNAIGPLTNKVAFLCSQITF